jgi:hypothetical protein
MLWHKVSLRRAVAAHVRILLWKELEAQHRSPARIVADVKMGIFFLDILKAFQGYRPQNLHATLPKLRLL